MKEFLVFLLVWLTAVDASASTNGAFLNDTLTIGEGAKRNVQNPAIRRVVIDPGHGGRDEGCSGAHSEEKEISLAIGLGLGNLIEARHPDIEVIYTRETDKFVALYERARIANKAQADLFISIHCNSIVGHDYINGSETYVMGLHNVDHNLNVAKRENAVVQLEENVDKNYSFDPNTPAGHITLSMFQHAFQEQSIAAASHIERRLGEREGRRSRGVRMAGFVVLKETAMPSVLVETGYLSNESEENYLTETTSQLLTIDALYNGFADYLDERTKEERLDRSVLAAQQRARIVNTPIQTYPSPQPAQTEPLLNQEPGSTETSSTPATVFFIQLAAAKTQIDTENQKWQSLGMPVRFVREGKMLKYQAGPFATRSDAEHFRAEAIAKNFNGAFVIGYKAGKKLSPAEMSAEK